MKQILIHFFILIIYLQVLPAQSMIKNIEENILEVKNLLAPDKRTAIFDVAVSEVEGEFILSGETNLPEAKNVLLEKLSQHKFRNEIKILPDESLGANVFGVVNISVANIRTKPEHSAEMATQALLGTIVKVYKKTDDGWYLIQTPDNYISWVDGEAIQLLSKDEADSWKVAEKIIYTINYGTAYENFNENPEAAVSDLVFGDILKLISSTEKSYLIEFPDGRKAVVNKNEAELFSNWLKNRTCTADNIISTAKKFIGIPYLWGGTSAKGLDCSGFTKTVCFANGILLPRDASQQVFVGETIDTEKDFAMLLPGDLLFFGFAGDQNKKERITHVAIYLGENDFIHASGRVRINSFEKSKNNFSKHRLTTFIRAKRIVNSRNQNGIQAIESNPFYK